MTNQSARNKITQAIMFPILGLLVAGIVGVIAVPEIARGTSMNDAAMVSGFAVLLVASIFGGSILWASQLTLQASKFISESTGQPLQQVAGAKTLAFVMHIIWLSINGMFWWIILVTYNFSYTDFFGGASSRPTSDLNPLTVVPLVLLAAMLVGVHLLFMDVRARTATAPKPIWQAPYPPMPPQVPQVPQAPQAPTQG